MVHWCASYIRFVVLPSSTYSQQVSRLYISLDHTQTHTTVGRTPLDEGSARRRDLYLTTQTLYKTNIHAAGRIRTHDPSKRSAADLRLRPRDHRDRRVTYVWWTIIQTDKHTGLCVVQHKIFERKELSPICLFILKIVILRKIIWYKSTNSTLIIIMRFLLLNKEKN
jgi:hypothetical protein